MLFILLMKVPHKVTIVILKGERMSDKRAVVSGTLLPSEAGNCGTERQSECLLTGWSSPDSAWNQKSLTSPLICGAVISVLCVFHWHYLLLRMFAQLIHIGVKFPSAVRRITTFSREPAPKKSHEFKRKCDTAHNIACPPPSPAPNGAHCYVALFAL
jgi:hypothetical protein